MRLWLVRHGQSTWNLERRLQGQTHDVPLTEVGHEQASRAGGELAGLGVGPAARLLSSDLLRAWQTAVVIGQALGIDPTPDERLREQHYGVLQGRLTADLRAEPVPEGLDITEVAWGGGESIEQVYVRVRDLLVELSAVPGDAVLVTHGDTLRVALTVIDQLNRGEPTDRPWRDVAWPVVANGSVTRVMLSTQQHVCVEQDHSSSP